MSLIDSLVCSERLSRVFADANLLRAMLAFECALARVESRLGVIPAQAAAAVESAAASDFDLAELSREAYRAGTPAIPLVRMLKQRGAPYAHWGSTSQDVCDTALMLLLRECRPILEQDHFRIAAALTKLSNEHANTVMLGRTLLQPEPPVTFGLKCAGWLAALDRCWTRVTAAFDEAICLQFGGASGTLAAFGSQGLAVSEALAEELSLRLPDAPWHAHRDRLAALLAALSIHTASLAKLAQDIALLMQFEVGEAAEPGGAGRGGSSAMPHKHNPTACLLTISSAKRTPGLLANFLTAMPQEHERALGGWQSEWGAVQGIVQAAGVALESMAEATEGLTVSAARMRANLDATQGAVFSERRMLQLEPEVPGQPEDYLGSAEAFRQRLLKGEK